ncbi:MAG TPA: hypothetical protein VKY74_24735 [Chloroflexia bacterium]|nr:hypothetical protein [Chloroflexia bacterium]
MHYNSLDHFLTVHQPELTTLMTEAMQVAGGYYAALTPAALHQLAVQDAANAQRMLLAAHLDRQSIQGSTRQLTAQGIPIPDLIRAAQEMELRMLAFGEQQLATQPDLHLELVRRIQHVGASYRSNVTAVQIDETLRRLQDHSPRPRPGAG